MKKIVFTGGGSAGHVVPNIALMEELLSSGEADVCYIGTDGIEKRLVSEWKIPYHEIECPKLIRGGGFSGFKRNLKIPSAFFRAVKQAKEGLLTFQPDAVFSKGGYVALPVVVAAKKLKIPCFAHESDFSAGLANKLSSRFCKRVFTSFPETAKKFKRGVYSGAPLRRAVLSATRAEARRKLDLAFSDTVVFVFGGGSGSETINRALRKHLKTLTEKYVILHACGKGNVVKSNLKNYRQYEYVSDIGNFYAASDVIVSRAGAGTVFEILALKKRAILIPLEGQTRGDQVENAAYFAKKGLCKVLRQTELDKLPEALERTLADERLKENLLSSSFTSGNERILSELRAATKEKR
ncbi:MAG: UDP-N-acetylglucosamine--N-acetylmuramyl-(pentapeptide) pyrophosphoryl-undecaprenol N-acetylglucosamine transferase [Clostridia bacterium]|nr:UDP-N-acetylglucosamine--N-acetylmuramyl-(pentapeptide) pyrophosphoryl-undecaprenol N-acetylglucosamine transferase [Clostridia bacterium]